MSKDLIYFYSISDWPQLSNFAVCNFKDKDGNVWKTNEHYYQAHKFKIGSPEWTQIRDAEGPLEALRLSRKHSKAVRADWEQIREKIMAKGLRMKFKIPLFETVLRSTGNRELIEDSPNPYWGSGSDGKGQNRLGILLMNLREEIVGPDLEKLKEYFNK